MESRFSEMVGIGAFHQRLSSAEEALLGAGYLVYDRLRRRPRIARCNDRLPDYNVVRARFDRFGGSGSAGLIVFLFFAVRFRGARSGSDDQKFAATSFENGFRFLLRFIAREPIPVVDAGQRQHDIGRKLQAILASIDERARAPFLHLRCQHFRPMRASHVVTLGTDDFSSR